MYYLLEGICDECDKASKHLVLLASTHESDKFYICKSCLAKALQEVQVKEKVYNMYQKSLKLTQ